MANVKTAISLERPLLEQVDEAAQELGIPRSHLFVLAVEEFLQRRENQQLLDAINAAYVDSPDPEEEARMAAMQRKQREMVEGSW
ncbi:MAG: CopG family transcriptional regulator [Ardenticatenaceae bacterium]|nr:CopG family transcriptional regulator [Ardenticatenaceae bacterium]MCB8991300.1 CopG family transcriptional regulator [Ardenticatenaceae bacterium]MCB9003659.1 CopG family transcriptional regulator [Ardenticatenaceae bacterium]